MVISNIRFAVRKLIKNKVLSLINILGLSIALLASIAILKHVAFERNFDSFHQNSNSIYRLSISYTDMAGSYGEYAGLSNAIGPKLTEEQPQILRSTRIFPLAEGLRHTIISASSQNENKEFSVNDLWSVDKEIFELFTFSQMKGHTQGFSAVLSSIAISESIAIQFFGKEDPIGQEMKLNGRINLIVSSVFKDWPENSHLHPEILIQTDYLETLDMSVPNMHFVGSNSYTYLQLREGTSLEELDMTLSEFVKENKRTQDYEDVALHLTPLDDIHLNAHTQKNDMAEINNGNTLSLLVLLSFLILLIAWFNYINLITSSTLQKSKEIAIRRIHGAKPYVLFVQRLLDSAITVFFALFIALTANQFLSPSLAEIIGQGTLLDLVDNSALSFYFLLFLGFCIFISAAYPTALLSSFKSVQLIKGNLKMSKGTGLTKKVLVVSQYMVTIGLVFGALVVINQVRHIKSIETKLDLESVLVLKGPGIRGEQGFKEAISTFSKEVMSIAGVEGVTTSNVVPGQRMDYAAALANPKIHGEEPNFIKRIFADEFFVDVYEIEVTSGRFFTSEATLPIEDRSIVVNEAAALNLGYDPPSSIVGAQVEYWRVPIKVIGVVEDFHLESPDKPLEPMFFFPTYDTKHFSIKISNSQPADLIAAIEEKWEKVYAGNPFDYFFSKVYFDRQYQAFDQLERQLTLLAILCISVASLGLFALAFDAARQRVKEVGIRKVLGAGVLNIMRLFIGNYAKLILISAIIATPLVYYMMTNWLENYANRITIGIQLLIYPTVGVLVMAVLVIAIHTLRVAQMNPVESLRQE